MGTHVLVGLLALGVAAVFLVSGIGKASHFAEVRAMLEGLGVPWPVVLSVALAVAEGLTALTLFTPQTFRFGAVACACLGACIAGAALVAVRSRRDIRCACFGGQGSILGSGHVVRGVCLILAGVFLSTSSVPWNPDQASGALTVLIVVLLIVALTRTSAVSRSAAEDRRALGESTIGSTTG